MSVKLTKAFLTGSRVYGLPDADSDVDLVIDELLKSLGNTTQFLN